MWEKRCCVLVVLDAQRRPCPSRNSTPYDTNSERVIGRRADGSLPQKEREAELLGKLNAAEAELEHMVMSDSAGGPKLQSSASFARTAALDITISHEKQAAAISASTWIRNFQKSVEMPKEELASRAELSAELVSAAPPATRSLREGRLYVFVWWLGTLEARE